MGLMEVSKVVRATSRVSKHGKGERTVKTNIPLEIVTAVGLVAGDRLIWEVNGDGEHRITIRRLDEAIA